MGWVLSGRSFLVRSEIQRKELKFHHMAIQKRGIEKQRKRETQHEHSTSLDAERIAERVCVRSGYENECSGVDIKHEWEKQSGGSKVREPKAESRKPEAGSRVCTAVDISPNRVWAWLVRGSSSDRAEVEEACVWWAEWERGMGKVEKGS